MDYAKPISAANNITLDLAMYRPKDPKGVLFFNPGGSDPTAVVAWQVALNIESDFTPNFHGLLEYDLMSNVAPLLLLRFLTDATQKVMEVRGLWASNPLNVSLDTFAPLVGAYPSSEREYDAYQQAAKVMFQSWTDLSAPAGIIEHVGTRETVQDYDRVRIALGYEKIHFLGASYGTYRAAQYAATFPERVGHFALDAVAPHGMSFLDNIKYDIIAANRVLLRADAFCQNNASCPFHNEGKGGIPEAWREVLAKAANGTISACANGTPCNETLSTSDVQSILLGLLSGQPDFPELFAVLEGALSGDGAELAASGPLTIDAVWAVPLECGDNRVYDASFSGYQKLIRTMEEADTNHIHRSGSLSLFLVCAAWPYKSAPTEPLDLQAPMLLVTADFEADAATEKATFVWTTQTPHSALAVRHGDDHVSFDRKFIAPSSLFLTREADRASVPLQASTNVTKAFLRSGVLPAARNETFITVYEPGMRRAAILDPYCVPTGLEAGDADSA
ncbi:hypothetical protein LTR85_007949 [Meristemomyces frigidus]|nr:hypothetical protein LTR85_007949 [Meristemomyces frigidus]